MFDRRLRQAFPLKSQILFGGCSVLLFGDFGQLPPVFGLVLYTTQSNSDLGCRAYTHFTKDFTLTQVMRQSGQDLNKNADTTEEDWEHQMEQTPTKITDYSSFDNALRLFPMVEESGHPIAEIKAVHTRANASSASPDDAGGLVQVVKASKSARVMLTSNLWLEVGLVNGAMGTVEAICYLKDKPLALPLPVMVWFDRYSGPTMYNGTVPITPIWRSWTFLGGQCSCLQLPLKLAWAVTIH
uniref:ATP-dependent DNA helicase n=1 Tax=Amphimedon queenslandica TaxID=400682 RepID=A0A1X7TX81_AMPQE